MNATSDIDLAELCDWLADVSDLTDQEVLDELAAAGIDHKTAMARFEASILPRLRTARRRQRLHVVRDERLARGEPRDWLAYVRSLAMPIEQLVARIHAYGPAAVANRKLVEPTREDLEILLADLMALEADEGR